MGKRKRDSCYLTRIEELVLLAVHYLGDNADSASIWSWLQERGQRLSLAGAYFALERLEKRKLISSSIGAPIPGRGGRPRKYFSVTISGNDICSDLIEKLQGAALRSDAVRGDLAPGGAT